MDRSSNAIQERAARRCDGFTLIELLVVVAVIAILVSVLLPALQSARGIAQKIGGANIQRQMVLGQIAYASDNDGIWAGPSDPNSGAGMLVQYGGRGNIDRYAGNTSGTTPTSTHDWISPTLGAELDFDTNRAKRTQDIFNNLACPSASRIADTIYTQGSASPDEQDFRDVISSSPFNQVSFLSPAVFHLYPAGSGDTQALRAQGEQLARQGFRSQSVFGELFNANLNNLGGSYRVTASTATNPNGYRPRLDRVRNQSVKVFVADGNRYLDTPGGLDFDISPSPGIYGSFLGGSPMFSGSTAYGRDESPSNGQNVFLSIRHGGNTQMNVTRFDGSGSTITTDTLWADPTPWHPSGSVFNARGRTTDEAIEFTADWERNGEIIIP